MTDKMNGSLSSATIAFDEDLIVKYDRNGPRYTSYPTADRFTSNFDASHYRRAMENRTSNGPDSPVSLYFHLQ